MRHLIGIGCDIVQVARMTKACRSDLFLPKVFCADEQTYFKAYHHPWPIIAGHFAAKEAIVKALGTGFSQGISFQDIMIGHESSGKPHVKLSAVIEQRWPGICIELSISHEQEYAVAYALAYLK